MLCADAMPRTDDPALEKRERGLDGIGVNRAIRMNMAAVVDSHVLTLAADDANSRAVGAKIIGNQDFDILADIFFDVLRQRARLHILSLEEAKFPAALFDANHDFLVLVFPRPRSSDAKRADNRAAAAREESRPRG